MGMNDWRNKKDEDLNAEDVFWFNVENCCRICGALTFPFQDHIYWLDEDGSVLCCEKESKNLIEKREYSDDEMMMDDVWPNGMSLAEMMRKVPGIQLQHPNFYKPQMNPNQIYGM